MHLLKFDLWISADYFHALKAALNGGGGIPVVALWLRGTL